MGYESSNQIKEVNEAVSVYFRSIKQPSNKNLVRNFSLRKFFEDRLLVVQTIKKGLPFNLFTSFQSLLPFSENEWANILNLSTKSLHRYKQMQSFNFKPIHSEKILQLTEVASLGIEVFASYDKFTLWLNTPCFALGNMKPKELISDSYGIELVTNELQMVEHGFFA